MAVGISWGQFYSHYTLSGQMFMGKLALKPASIFQFVTSVSDVPVQEILIQRSAYTLG